MDSDSLPEEIFRYVFQKLPGKDILRCRQVCKLWKERIDDCIKTEEFWMGRCAAEFSEIYIEAKRKALPSLTWREMYKSLSLWSSLGSANVRCEQLFKKKRLYDTSRALNVESGVVVTMFDDEIVKFMYVNNKKVNSFVYLELHGQLLKYYENDRFIVTLQSPLTLQSPNQQTINGLPTLEISPKEGNKVSLTTVKIENVIDFICVNNTIYYARNNIGVYCYEFHPSSVVAVQNNLSHIINKNEQTFLFEINYFVLMSYKYNKVIAIEDSEGYRTMIFYDVETGAITREHLPTGEDIFQKLLSYDFSKYMVHTNWHRLEQVMYEHLYGTKNKLEQHIESGYLFFISACKIYGDIIFIGFMGCVLVFYNPYNNGEIDFDIKPVKIYEMFKYDQMIPGFEFIYNIDVIESKTGPVLIISCNGSIFALTLSYACEEYQKEK